MRRIGLALLLTAVRRRMLAGTPAGRGLVGGGLLALVVLPAGLLVALFASASSATPVCTTTWKTTAPVGGGWFVAANWDNGVPNNTTNGWACAASGSSIALNGAATVKGVSLSGILTANTSGPFSHDGNAHHSAI